MQQEQELRHERTLHHGQQRSSQKRKRESKVPYCNVFGYCDTSFGLLIGFISIFTSCNYMSLLQFSKHMPNLHKANLLYSASLASATNSTVDLFEASGIHSRISLRELPITTDLNVASFA
jgi:hypothetical protein